MATKYQNYIDKVGHLSHAWDMIDAYQKGEDMSRFVGTGNVNLSPQQQAEYWLKRGATSKEAFGQAHYDETTDLITGDYQKEHGSGSTWVDPGPDTKFAKDAARDMIAGGLSTPTNVIATGTTETTGTTGTTETTGITETTGTTGTTVSSSLPGQVGAYIPTQWVNPNISGSQSTANLLEYRPWEADYWKTYLPEQQGLLTRPAPQTDYSLSYLPGEFRDPGTWRKWADDHMGHIPEGSWITNPTRWP